MTLALFAAGFAALQIVLIIKALRFPAKLESERAKGRERAYAGIARIEGKTVAQVRAEMEGGAA